MVSLARGTNLRLSVTMMKLALVLSISTSLISPVQSSFIRFKPDTEYIYTFHSSTDLKKVRTLHAESQIGFVLVRGFGKSNELQEIYLRVHSASVTSQDERVLLSEEKDFSDWFSFDISENGAIGQVYYPRDEDDHVIWAKKGLASLLAGNLQHPPADKKLNAR
ncbi:uncharacterized protein LOC119724017 [Patiria miniata]|uniref:Uncharacterized protein n=1 Tax=Patiria miniata TaxID=46514 RepID=A0A913ZII5_PATMI|nr:uncharacterized protein LOC119724017 [Patiria miniata]